MTNINLPAKDSEHINFAHRNYHLTEKTGEGGFATVYKAKQRNTGKVVAIKFLTLPNSLSNAKKQQYLQRFEQETMLSACLDHPHIVRLLDKGQCSNQHVYAVFEFISGETLKHHLAWSGAMSIAAAANIMAQVLQALAHAHSKGVIHRDIKPANIMLSKTGTTMQAKILDFGIGILVNEQQQKAKNITLNTETLGTPTYSAPEQLRGESVSAKTDIYAWGLVFLECIMGYPAIRGSNLASVVKQHLNSENVPIPAAMNNTPLGNLICKAVNKNPQARAASANNLYHELTKLNITACADGLFSNTCNANQTKTATTNLDKTQAYQPNLLNE